jgi:hypothetical protein
MTLGYIEGRLDAEPLPRTLRPARLAGIFLERTGGPVVACRLRGLPRQNVLENLPMPLCLACGIRFDLVHVRPSKLRRNALPGQELGDRNAPGIGHGPSIG